MPSLPSPSPLRLGAALLAAALALPAPALAADEPAEEQAAAGSVRGTVPTGKSGEPVVVWLKDVPGDWPARVRSVEIRGGAFAPKVVVAAVGDVVKLVNQDGWVHAVASAEGGYDLGLLDKGEARGQQFLRPGAYVQRCAIHKEVLGWIFVTPSPHAAVADKNGAYDIRDVPPGRFAVATWSPGAAKVAEAGSAGAELAMVAPVSAPAAPARGGKAAPVPAPAPAPAPKKEARAEGGTIRGTVKAEPARYLEETVVYLKQVPGSWSARKLAMDQRKMKFIPHVMTVTAGDTVRFLNNDGLAHNVYSNDGEGYNLGMFKDGEERPYTFKRTGSYAQLCNIHPDMLAYVFVGQNPYAAVVDSSGRYEIHNVPPGNYTLAVWNSHLKAAERQVSVERGGSVDAGFTVRR